MELDNSLTVSGMVSLLAHETGGDAALYGRIARSLINVGLLPKASGRSVPTVSLEHRARFLLACMATDKPSEAPLAMLHRFEANEARGNDSALQAGRFLIDHMRYIIDLDETAWSLWTYSRLSVSRSSPIVTARFNDNLIGFSDVTIRQQQFVNSDAIMELGRTSGFSVEATCGGGVIIALAMGINSIDATHIINGGDAE